MKIAMIGQKGVPATWGGVERHVEELGARLVELGHQVTVFTRPNYTDPALSEYRGMRLVSLPTLGTKHLDAIVHSLIASVWCWRGGYDIVHYHSVGPCLASPISRLRGRRIVATIHGRDWKRSKWGALASGVLRLGEWLALRVPDATICVSDALRAEYLVETGRSTRFVPNGVSVEASDDTDALASRGLTDGEYLLFFGRLVPEKGLHHLLAAYEGSGVEMPLVVVGDTSNSDDYVASLKRLAGEHVIFAGYEFGARLAALIRRAALVVLPSDLEGLPIALLETVAYGAPVLASDIPPNREVLGADGTYFRAGDAEALRHALRAVLDDVDAARARVANARKRIMATYEWDAVARQTVEVYKDVL